MDGLTAALTGFTRESVGIEPKPGVPPVIDLLARYEAEVKAASDDGKTVDVTPLDTRLDPMQGIEVRVGVAGMVGVVQPGAVVLIGWEHGDPRKPFAEPSWKSGATLEKLVFNAVAVFLGGEDGAQYVALANKVNAELAKIATAFSTFVAGSGGASFPDAYTEAGDVSAEVVKAK